MASAASSLSFSSSVATVSSLLASTDTPRHAPSSVACRPMAVVAGGDLESRSLGELRTLARQRGLRGDTRAELIQLLSSSLSSNGSAATPAAAPASSNGASSGAGIGLDARALQVMPLAQLRAVARTRGVQGSTRDQLIAALLGPAAAAKPAAAAPAPASPAPVAVEYSAPAAPAAPAGGITRQQLLSKSLPALKAMARGKGIANLNALTKEQIVTALSGPAAAPAAPPAASFSAPVAPAAPAAPEPAGTALPEVFSLEQLQALSLGQLRSLGKEYGVRGDTKSELVSLLNKTGEAPAASRSTATATATATPPQALPAFESAVPLPPFQSAAPEGGSLALEPVKLASEVSALRQAMEDIEARDKVMEAERNSLLEQANFLRNVLVGGIGLAVVPLLLPFQIAPTTTASLQTVPAAAPAASVVPSEPVAPPAPPPPVVREVSPEDYCAAMPSDLLSPQVAKFCEALIEPQF